MENRTKKKMTKNAKGQKLQDKNIKESILQKAKQFLKLNILRIKDIEENYEECKYFKCSNSDSIQVMYNESLRLYNLELDSYEALANKINGTLLITGTIIALVTAALVQLITIQLSLNIFLFSILISLTYLFLILSLFDSGYAYLTESLPIINKKTLFKKYHYKEKNEILDILSCKIIQHATTINLINIKKSEHLKRSLILMLCGISVFVIFIIISLISYRFILH